MIMLVMLLSLLLLLPLMMMMMMMMMMNTNYNNTNKLVVVVVVVVLNTVKYTSSINLTCYDFVSPVNCSETRLKSSCMDVVLPTKVADIFRPRGGISQTAVFTLLGIHSTK